MKLLHHRRVSEPGLYRDQMLGPVTFNTASDRVHISDRGSVLHITLRWLANEPVAIEFTPSTGLVTIHYRSLSQEPLTHEGYSGRPVEMQANYR